LITIAAAIAYVGMMTWLFLRRRFLFVLLLVFVVGFSSRMVSTVYLDLSGPIYSIQLFRDIGGGWAAAPLLLAHCLYVAAYLVVFSSRAAGQLAAQADRLFASGPTRFDRRVATAVFILYAVFTVLLFGDMFRIGIIPLLAGLERFEYTELYGGFWHRMLMDYGMLLALPLGVFYAYGVFFRKRADNRFLGLLIALFAYLFLAGHRFSAFYSHGTAFAIPYAAVVCWQHFGTSLTAAERWRLEVTSKIAQGCAVVLVVGLIGGAVYNSYYFTRDVGRDLPFESLTHRVLVQQGELWYATWERVFVRDGFNPGEAFRRVFIDPVADANRNTTLPFLMVAEIGDKAYTALDVGSAYSGGYPEIIVELFGPFGAYLAIFAIGLFTAALVRLLLVAMLERRYLRIGFCWYVLFAFVLIPLSGMLNFLVNWKYALKVTALLGWMALEWDRDLLRRVGRTTPLDGGQTVAAARLDPVQ
jgi:hypothetical protein